MKNKNAVSQMRPKTYQVLELAVEDGVKSGWHRAHKHVNNPSENDIQIAIQESVLGSIYEWFHFDGEENF